MKEGKGMNLKKDKHTKKFLKVILIVAIIAVMFVPMLYSSIYLEAIWDAYGNIDKVPVAFVNMDKPYLKDGKEYAIGRELENNLKENNKVAWKFVDYEDAKKGVEGTEYYAFIEIPEGFSQKVANSQDGKFTTPEIIYTANKGRNFVFSQISDKVAQSIKSEVSSNIQKEISAALVDSLYDVKVSIKDAAEGSGELQAGTKKLLNGSKELADGTQKAADGSTQLQNGFNQAADASVKLQNGTEKLLDGSSDLSNGIRTAAVGSAQLQGGLTSLINGENQLTEGSVALVNGLNTMKNSLTVPNNNIQLLVQGASQVNNSAALIEQGAEKLNTSLNTGLNSLADGVKQASDGISQASSVFNTELENINNSNLSQADKDKLIAAITAINNINSSNMSNNIEAPLRKAAVSAQPLVGNLKQLNAGTKQLSDGVSQLASGLADSQIKAAAGLDQLINGAKGIQNGSSSITAGLNTVSEKTGELSCGLDQLNSGSIALKDGLKALNEGTGTLKDGLSTAAVKTGELSAGLKQLSEGSTSLNSGLGEANNGAVKLKDGLNNGYNKISSNLKFTSGDMSEFVSEPVTVKNTSINDVKYYGEGLAPYFISLSLWIGTLFISLIFSIEKILKVFKSEFMNSFAGKLITGSALAGVQAVILSFVLIKAVGMMPVSMSSFYLSNILIAIVFFSVMYGVSHGIGIIGAPIMFIVLLLQLASSGGTFPIETAPAFYHAVGNFIPMTYSVNIFRMIISGVNSSVLSHNIIIMLIFMFASLGGGLIIRAIINYLKKETINYSKSA